MARTKVEPKVENTQEEVIAKLMEQMAELQKQVNESKKREEEAINGKSDLEKLVEALKSNQGNSLSGKQVKIINLMNCAINVSTEPDGMGRVFTLENYGDSRFVKFDDLRDIVSAYPYTMEHGLIYVADANAVAELGLDYTNVYTKEVMDKIEFLRDETDVDLFIGMEENLRESMAVKIANKLNANEKMDYNHLNRIKNETGIDIQEIAKTIKEDNSKNKDKE